MNDVFVMDHKEAFMEDRDIVLNAIEDARSGKFSAVCSDYFLLALERVINDSNTWRGIVDAFRLDQNNRNMND